MKRSFQQDYLRCRSLKNLALFMSGVVVFLFLWIRMDETVPLWAMITAVVCALLDIVLVLRYSHCREALAKQMKRGGDLDE